MSNANFEDCCNLCGQNKYKILREAYGITMSYDVCPICKLKKPIIPARDWAWMCKETEVWD